MNKYEHVFFELKGTENVDYHKKGENRLTVLKELLCSVLGELCLLLVSAVMS